MKSSFRMVEKRPGAGRSCCEDAAGRASTLLAPAGPEAAVLTPPPRGSAPQLGGAGARCCARRPREGRGWRRVRWRNCWSGCWCGEERGVAGNDRNRKTLAGQALHGKGFSLKRERASGAMRGVSLIFSSLQVWW